MTRPLLAAPLLWASPLLAQGGASLDARIQAMAPRMIEVREQIHRHPELGNQETRTAELVADELRPLGLEVRTGIAYTGVGG